MKADEWILEHYYIVASAVSNFPEVSRDRQMALLDDLAARELRRGPLPRRFHTLRGMLGGGLGDPDMVRSARRHWERTPPDARRSLGEEAFRAVGYHLFFGEDREAVEAARPILATGDATLGPSQLASCVLVPLVKLGRPAEAVGLYPLVARHYDPPRGKSWEWGLLCHFLALTDNAAVGLRTFAAALPGVLAEADPLGRMHFLFDSVVLFDRLRQTRKSVAVRLPRAVPVYKANGQYPPTVLRDWVRGEAAELAAKFDARNGNDHFARRHRRPRGRPTLAVAAPAPGSSRGGCVVSEPADRIRRLLAEADRLEHGPARFDLADEAVRLADLHGDADLATEGDSTSSGGITPTNAARSGRPSPGCWRAATSGPVTRPEPGPSAGITPHSAWCADSRSAAPTACWP